MLAYFGDAAHREPVELTPPPYLTDDRYSHFLCYVEWDAPWRPALENGLDPMHGAFLHRQSHSMYAGETKANFQIRETDVGFFFEKTDQRGVSFDWVEYAFTGIEWLNLEIPYPPTAGPGGPFGIVAMYTPISQTTSAAFFWRYRQVSGWERDVWRFLYKTVLEERHWAVLEQDRWLLESMALDFDQHQHLYQHDLGVARIRRMMRREAEKQVAGLVKTP